MTHLDSIIISEQRLRLLGHSEKSHEKHKRHALESHQRDSAIMSILAGAKHSANPKHYNDILRSTYGAL